MTLFASCSDQGLALAGSWSSEEEDVAALLKLLNAFGQTRAKVAAETGLKQYWFVTVSVPVAALIGAQQSSGTPTVQKVKGSLL
jgi:hypothetical protein